MMRSVARRLERAFPWIFWAYVAMTVAILLAALVPAFTHPPAPAAGHPPPRDAAEQLGLMFGHTGGHNEDAGSIAVGYALSVLSLGTGLLLFLRRPRDPVARLLVVGMVGTSLAFNYQGHALFVGEAEVFVGASVVGAQLPIPPILNILHLAYHGLSGAAYAHALLLFPNGVLSPGWLRWPVLGMYLFLIEEVGFGVLAFVAGLPIFPILLTVLTILFGTVVSPTGAPCTTVTCPQGTPIQFDFSAIVASDVAFFIMFFGFVIPAAGIYALRAKRPLFTSLQRAQSEIVVLALAVALAVGLAAVIFTFLLLGAPRDLIGSREAEQLRDLALKVFPPLYAVIPLSVVVAILRYRLFDIDRLVNRALVYGALSIALALTSVTSVVVLQGLLQRFVHAAFFVLMLDVVGTTLRPAHASVWLREPRS